ncbi:MAG TPA: hypothetical protein VL400_27930 [Polyangiaceae bacterium]|nr:hypothetical protein [Polyangiaceae bacterium]
MVAVAVACAASACGDDKPTVPFSMSAAETSGEHSGTPSSVTPTASGSAFSPMQGKPPDGDGSKLALGSATATPRAGRVFRQVLVGDADDDGAPDLVAWTETTAGGAGELVYFHGGEGGTAETVLAKLPKDLDLGRCSHEAGIARLSSTVFVVRVTAECGDGADATKESWLGFARSGGDAAHAPEVRLELRARGSLVVEASSADRDGDGQGDLGLVVKGDGKLEAPLVLYDRPSGFAWDPTEPEATLTRSAATLVARATKKDADVAADAERFLAFAGALCADLGDAAITTTAGPVRCGDGKFVSEAVYAVGLGALGAGDAQAAALALDMLARLPTGSARHKDLETKLGAKTKSVAAAVVRKPAAKPAQKIEPLAPLAWGEAGELLVVTDDGVVKVDPAGGETKSDAIAWPRGMAWRSGDATVDIVRAEKRCDPPRRVVVATAKGSTVTAPLHSIAALLPSEARKGSCKPQPLPLAPLAVDSTGATIAVGGEVYRLTYGDAGLGAVRAAPPGPDAPPSLPGSARSADGKASVLALGDGLLVLADGTAERWTGPDLSGLSGCVVKSSADRVACVTKSGVVIIAPK